MTETTSRLPPLLAQTLCNQLNRKAPTRAGYSAKTAAEQGARLLINVKVAEAIAKTQLLKKTSGYEAIAEAQSERSKPYKTYGHRGEIKLRVPRL